MTAKKYLRNVYDIKDATGKWISSYAPEPYVKAITRAGQLWQNMNTRCGEAYQSKCPTYQGVTNGFKDFQEFAEWCQTQEGYMNKDGKRFWQLDKDLLCPGSKLYSAETCTFMPVEVNTVFNDSSEDELKTGVSVYQYDNSKFIAHCRVKEDRGYMGVFDTEEAAHQAWRSAKLAHIAELVDKYKDYPRLVEGLKNKSKNI